MSLKEIVMAIIKFYLTELFQLYKKFPFYFIRVGFYVILARIIWDSEVSMYAKNPMMFWILNITMFLVAIDYLKTPMADKEDEDEE